MKGNKRQKKKKRRERKTEILVKLINPSKNDQDQKKANQQYQETKEISLQMHQTLKGYQAIL